MSNPQNLTGPVTSRPPVEAAASTAQVWEDAVAALSQDPRGSFNSADEICTRWARSQPERTALTVVDADGSARVWSYGELDDLSRRCATVLTEAGLRPGDRVAVMLSRQVESLIVALATWGSGLVYVPLYCGLGADAIQQRLEDSGARAVVGDVRWSQPLDAALGRLSSTPSLIRVGGSHDELWPLLERAEPRSEFAETRGADTATLMFTSGTTGPAKACAMPHQCIVSLIPFVRHSLGLAPERSRLFTTADPGWSYGLYSTGVVPMALGIERVIYTGDFDAQSWLDVVAAHSVTAIASAPSAYRRLAQELARTPLSSTLVTAASAGEPLLGETAEQWAAGGGPPIHDAYGLSEVGMVLGDTVIPPSGTQAGTLAGPIPGFEVRLFDDAGSSVAPGEPGRIAISRPPFQLATGYENAPRTWEKRWQDDYFLTEDMAVVEPDGRWRFVARSDDMIITRGFNVSPVEVEAVIAQLPEVAEAAVVPVEVPGRGTLVRAVVVLDGGEGGEQVETVIRDAVRERVARYAAPAVIDYVDQLPRTEAGKLKRADLRPTDPA